MSYYILPKNHNKVDISLTITNTKIKPYISNTLINYHNSVKNEIYQLCRKNLSDDEKIRAFYNEMMKNINPYEYVFSKVPGSVFSVSKLKPKSILFYDLFEIIQTINILDSFKNDNMNSLIIGKNYEDSLECLEILREYYTDDNFFCYTEYNSNLHNWIKNNKFNFIIYEIDEIMCTDNNNANNNYIINLLEILLIVINYLKQNGVVIIKIENMFHKSIIDIIYIFCSLFEKTYIIKPNTSNITTFDKYIVLKNFYLTSDKFDLFYNYTKIIQEFIDKYKNNNESINISSIIDYELPYHFLNKIDDINLIIGQQQLEVFVHLINILKLENKEEKLELLKKNNLQKSVQWCEKHRIPCNKFSEKINIFLPLKENKQPSLVIDSVSHSENVCNINKTEVINDHRIRNVVENILENIIENIISNNDENLSDDNSNNDIDNNEYDNYFDFHIS
jgi:hypothetical protein